MTPQPASASPPKPESLQDAATRAKRDFIAAAYAASPLRTVEKHPLASVTATAAASMAVTVLATSRMFSPAGVSLIGKGAGLIGMLAKSNLGNLAVQALLAKVNGASAGGNDPAAQADPSSPVNAVG